MNYKPDREKSKLAPVNGGGADSQGKFGKIAFWKEIFKSEKGTMVFFHYLDVVIIDWLDNILMEFIG